MPLPALDDAFPVPETCVAEHRASGHTVVCNLASQDEIEAWEPDPRWGAAAQASGRVARKARERGVAVATAQ